MIPMTFAILINFGIMGFTGIPLNGMTSLIVTLIIGIGVDGTIHFLLRLKRELSFSEIEKNLSIEHLIYKTIRHTGKAILFTSLALILGFSVFLTSSMIGFVHFGILILLTMLNAMIGTLIYLPSLLLTFPNIIKVRTKDVNFLPDDSFLYMEN